MYFIRTILIISISILFNSALLSQAPSVHRWKNRLVLLLTDDPDNPNLEEQLKVFTRDSVGLAERKLMVFIATSDKITRVFPRALDRWLESSSLYEQYHRKGDFELILFGLDGGEKLREQKPMTLSALYRIIDSMPMRAAEIKRNN